MKNLGIRFYCYYYYSKKYPIEKMFCIAADVNRYKEFVPWCIGSKVVRKVDERCSEVQLTVGFPPVVESYVSTVTLIRPYLVKSVSSDTRLFKQLISLWHFSRLFQYRNDYFQVMYEFQSPLHAAIASLFFDEVTKKMIVAFTERAKKLYGPPSIVT
ncbi:coenzyme Q binding protein COQ10 B [Trichuris trichiura]|uniref:Coenzyme Q binding protein COQ10 B n=1 Tax=Trichuris trichiura TaxID=36087 RepID=A0A077ZH31_TRITR|nr:coenzyme Q binding protein COQ10 B [Trichuris trichiura]